MSRITLVLKHLAPSRIAALLAVIALAATALPGSSGTASAVDNAPTSESGNIPEGFSEDTLGVRIIDGPANVRSDHSTNASVLAALPTGSEIPVDQSALPIQQEDGNEWVPVEYEHDKTGWISARLLEPLDYTPESDGNGGPAVDVFVNAKGVRVSDGPVNIRSGYSTTSSVISTADTGAEFPIGTHPVIALNSDGHNWIRVYLPDGISGVIALDYLVPLDYVPQQDSTSDWSTAKGARVVNGPVNVRAGAGLDNPVISTFETGDELDAVGPDTTIFSQDGFDWIQLYFNGDDLGWVATSFLLPLPYAPSDGNNDSDGTDASDFASALGVRVADGPINIREAPGLDEIIATTLNTGDEVPVYGASPMLKTVDGLEWLKILYGNGIMGWVATDYLTPLTYAPNLGSGDGWSTAIGFTVVDGPVNVREDASLDSDVVGTLSTGRVVYKRANSELTTADGHTWIRINSLYSDPHDGWVAIDFLQPLSEIPCGDGACYPDAYSDLMYVDQAVVVDGPVNFRAEPGTSGKVLKQLKSGDYVFMEKSESKFTNAIDGYYWVQATVGGVDGYIAVNYLDPVP